MMPPKAVLFDCDGVLVDSEAITARLLAEDLTAHGYPLATHEVHQRFVGGTFMDIHAELRGQGIDLAPDWVARFHARQDAVLGQEVEAIAGVGAVLDLLVSKGIAFAVVSNGPLAKMKVTLGRTGFWPLFAETAFSAHEVQLFKPDPALYLHAAKTMGFAPAECVVIEDSATGLRAGVAAGIASYGLTTDLSADAVSTLGGVPFDFMADLPIMLGII